ncbi:YeeE/YedE family protein [Phlyctema vagabunda]|uniref:YeeE/YedE family protein n=1 Tax=Phlyctema vagabunda TaxID=108571 RepID=A0ABR4PIA4_9HELO
MFSTIFTSGLAGTVFGAALAASGVYSPSIIISQMQLTDFHMLKVFLGASASSALIIILFEKLGLTKCNPRTPSSLGWFSKYDGNIVGGLLIGSGMTLTGACPGTSLVQLAAGVRSGKLVVCGGVLGGIIYSRFGKYIRRDAAVTAPSCHTVQEQLNISRASAVLAYESICLATVSAVLALAQSHPDLISSTYGSLCIGSAQAASLLLTGNLVGVSGAYEEVAQVFWRTVSATLGGVSTEQKPLTFRSIIFVSGIMIGSYAAFLSVPSLFIESDFDISTTRALAGGFAISIGARTAGGCTSGHGISGMSTLSVSSIITVMAMFGGGIGLATLK